MTFRKMLLLGASVVACDLIISTQPVFAQSEQETQSETNETALKIDKVVVTARKRDESLQDVPLAVTAFDGAAIERAHASTVTEIERYVPNVDFADNPFAGQALGATIRGVGFSDLEKSFEPAVGFSIDGVFLASNTGAAIDMFDIEQIEVLRGPQGTLFGRNTVGGVINVRRTRPTGEFGAKLGTRFTNHDGREYLAVVNAPQIGGVLSTKAYAFSKKNKTFAENILTGEKEDQTDIFSGGLAFLFEPNDKFEALVSIDYFDDQSQGPPTYNLTQPGELFCDLPNNLILFGVLAPSSQNAGCASTSIDVAEASDFESFVRGVPFVTTLEGTSVTANIEYELTDNLTLTSVTGYRETDEQLLQDNIGGPLVTLAVAPVSFPILYQQRLQNSDQFSQEFRISGDLTDHFTFVSGIYYLNSTYTLDGGIYPDGSGPGTTQSFGAIAANTSSKQDATAWAIFADGTYQITDRLAFSGGLRYSYEEKTFDNNFILSSVPGVTGQVASITESWDSPTWRTILQYDLSDNAMIYGGWSHGFRSGGFNGRAGTPTALGPYDPETVDSFEAGLRADLFGGRLRFNPTVFVARYNDKQEENLIATPGGAPGATETTVQNASKVDIEGAELEFLALLTPELTLRGAFGVVNAEFTEFLVPEDPTDPTNTNLIDVSDTRNLRSGPDSTVSLGGTYSRPIFDNGLLLTVDANYSWQDELVTSRASDSLGLNRDTIDSEESVDFSVKVETQREHGPNLSVSAFINDAFDDAPGRLANAIIVPDTFTFGTGARTKVYGIEATIEF